MDDCGQYVMVISTKVTKVALEEVNGTGELRHIQSEVSYRYSLV
jgi:hypothetical protein